MNDESHPIYYLAPLVNCKLVSVEVIVDFQNVALITDTLEVKSFPLGLFSLLIVSVFVKLKH